MKPELVRLENTIVHNCKRRIYSRNFFFASAFNRPKLKSLGFNKKLQTDLVCSRQAAKMEAKARDIFRHALAMHYIDDIEAGDKVEEWLRKHKGWLPDPQVLYGDGTPPQPRDEGTNVSSPFPAEAVKEAFTIMNILRTSLYPVYYEETLKDVVQWLEEYENLTKAPRSRSRSRSRSLESKSRALLRDLRQETLLFEAKIRRMEMERKSSALRITLLEEELKHKEFMLDMKDFIISSLGPCREL